ncbi:MAG: hypothetical protein AB2603_17530 [Candidatus Thiodiazotropha endolucinida]
MRGVTLFLLSLCFLAPSVKAEMREPGGYLLAPPCKTYHRPSRQELSRVRILFSKLLRGITDQNAMRSQWKALGFDWLPVELDGESIVVLKEHASRCEGRGLFMIRTASGPLNLLQIPHRFHDKKTGNIGYALMRHGDFRIAAFNSISRYARNKGGDGKDADLVRNGDNYFTALAEAAALLSADSRVIQIHGFDSAKRNSDPGRNSQVIISDGTRRPSGKVQALARCLASDFDEQVGLYPRDVDELGATTNQIGSKLRHYDHRGFMHIELSRVARHALLTDCALMTKMVGCLSGRLH